MFEVLTDKANLLKLLPPSVIPVSLPHHSREGGNLMQTRCCLFKIPAFAGMTRGGGMMRGVRGDDMADLILRDQTLICRSYKLLPSCNFFNLSRAS